MSGVGVFERLYSSAMPHYSAVSNALLVLGTGASEHVQAKLDLGASEHVLSQNELDAGMENHETKSSRYDFSWFYGT